MYRLLVSIAQADVELSLDETPKIHRVSKFLMEKYLVSVVAKEEGYLLEIGSKSGQTTVETLLLVYWTVYKRED